MVWYGMLCYGIVRRHEVVAGREEVAEAEELRRVAAGPRLASEEGAKQQR